MTGRIIICKNCGAHLDIDEPEPLSKEPCSGVIILDIDELLKHIKPRPSVLICKYCGERHFLNNMQSW